MEKLKNSAILCSYMTSNFAETLKKIRKIKQLTLEQVAEGIDVHHTTVQRWEAQKTDPKYTDFLRLCAFLQISPEELAGDIDLNVKKLEVSPVQAIEVLTKLVQQSTIEANYNSTILSLHPDQKEAIDRMLSRFTGKEFSGVEKQA